MTVLLSHLYSAPSGSYLDLQLACPEEGFLLNSKTIALELQGNHSRSPAVVSYKDTMG